MQRVPLGRAGRRWSLQPIRDLRGEAEAEPFGHPSLLLALGQPLRPAPTRTTLCHQAWLRDAQATAEREPPDLR
jgi:hypothetical protein